MQLRYIQLQAAVGNIIIHCNHPFNREMQHQRHNQNIDKFGLSYKKLEVRVGSYKQHENIQSFCHCAINMKYLAVYCTNAPAEGDHASPLTVVTGEENSGFSNQESI